MERVRDVLLCRSRGDPELRGDLLVGRPARDERDDFALARGELARPLRAGDRRLELRAEVLAERGPRIRGFSAERTEDRAAQRAVSEIEREVAEGARRDRARW